MGRFSFNPDQSKIKDKINHLQTGRNRSDKLWKPSGGEQMIRILPYIHNEDMSPFIELMFHYNLPGKNWISPASGPIGKPDPIYEFTETLRNSGGDYDLVKKVEPKKRTYAPILVRGQEHSGIKFWGFGKTIYKELVQFLDDEDYGIYPDPYEGMDIKLTYTTREESNTNYPKTDIMIRPRQKPALDDVDRLDGMLEEQDNIVDLFDIPEYETLKEILQDFQASGFDEEQYKRRVRMKALGKDPDAEQEESFNPSSEQRSWDEDSNEQDVSDEDENIDDIEKKFDSILNN